MGGNIKAIEKCHKRVIMVEKEKFKDEVKEMERFGERKKGKSIHGPLLFGAKGKNNKRRIRKRNMKIKGMARQRQKVVYVQIRV